MNKGIINKDIIEDYFNSMEPFRDVDDIPDVPRMKDEKEYREIVVKNLIRCGAIPKSELVTGAVYAGSCRNSDTATWNGKEFEYTRWKFGTSYVDSVNHFEDDDGYDLFVPIRKVSD